MSITRYLNVGLFCKKKTTYVSNIRHIFDALPLDWKQQSDNTSVAKFTYAILMPQRQFSPLDKTTYVSNICHISDASLSAWKCWNDNTSIE